VNSQPYPLAPSFRERVWGRRDLRPFFPQPFKAPVGEAWFQCDGDPQSFGTAVDPSHPGICPLLVKLLFTSERLSVQVHPGDEYAERHHSSLGKTEAWYVLDAQPPGEVAVGFRSALTREKFKAAARSGEIERLLDWRKVNAGDVIFTPAGTVHAIGAGLTICEIQQNSDITYRLYDYGRPRELHLERGAEVSHLGPMRSSHSRSRSPNGARSWSLLTISGLSGSGQQRQLPFVPVRLIF
jgi:mannose-6-phosphate isomerase